LEKVKLRPTKLQILHLYLASLKIGNTTKTKEIAFQAYPAVSSFSITSSNPARSKLVVNDRVFLELYGFFRILEGVRIDSNGDVPVQESCSWSGVFPLEAGVSLAFFLESEGVTGPRRRIRTDYIPVPILPSKIQYPFSSSQPILPSSTGFMVLENNSSSPKLH
jgi:hypothetical protein